MYSVQILHHTLNNQEQENQNIHLVMSLEEVYLNLTSERVREIYPKAGDILQGLELNWTQRGYSSIN